MVKQETFSEADFVRIIMIFFAFYRVTEFQSRANWCEKTKRLLSEEEL